MDSIARRLQKMIRFGFWPGFTVGMYPSVSSYQPLQLDPQRIWTDTSELNLYYHIPFCRWKCSFCTFFSTVCHDDQLIAAYIDRVNKQFRYYSDCFDRRVTVTSLCFGGGTPNAVPLHLYKTLFRTLTDGNVSMANDLEASMEVSPELLTMDYVDGLAELGIRRLSLGVQSLNEGLRHRANRDRNLDLARLMSTIHERGFCINVDLINGLEGQDERDFMDTLQEIVRQMPETISIYPLAGRGSSARKTSNMLMSNKEKYELFDRFYEYLIEHGYRCESHVKFVRANQNSTHQQKIREYQGVDTLGIGCGARSYNTAVHYCAPGQDHPEMAQTTVQAYIKEGHLSSGWIGVWMTPDETRRRFAIYSFFLGELDPGAYMAKFGTSFHEDFSQELAALVENGLICDDGDGHVCLTYKGRKYTDLVGTTFWSPRANELYASSRVVS